MKQLICEQDIPGYLKRGETTVLIDTNTIITTAAVDAASAAGLKLSYASDPAPCATCEDVAPAAGAGLDPELVLRAVKSMARQGLLQDIVGSGQQSCDCSHTFCSSASCSCSCGGHN